MQNAILKTCSLLMLVFGLLTAFAGGSVIFDLFEMRAEEGHYVLFVVWANFICGFLYLMATYGFYKRKYWTKFILTLATIILAATFAGLLLYVKSGGLYEQKTIIVMVFRIVLTIVLLQIAGKIKSVGLK